MVWSEANLPAPEGTPVGPGRPEQRRQGRGSCTPFRPVRFLVRPSFHHLFGLVIEASPTGLGLWLAEPLEEGAVLALEIRGLQRGQTGIRSARVVHCTAGADGFWRVGCLLAAPLTDRELASLRGGERIEPS